MRLIQKQRLLVLLLAATALACRTLMPSTYAAQPTEQAPPKTVRSFEKKPLPVEEIDLLDLLVEDIRVPREFAPLLEDQIALEFGPLGFGSNDRGRPRLSGSPRTLDTPHFRIHYTTTGKDAVNTEDDNANGYPDYVEVVAYAMEYSWYVEIEHFGWAIPPSDGVVGGDDRYDVYLEDIFGDGTAGYTQGGFSGAFVGDNPNTSIFELRSSTSYIGLDNDYDGLTPAHKISRLDLLRSTASHEFMHAIQFGYDADEPLSWLWEATATWMQDEVYNHVNDGDEVLEAVFKSTDTCQQSFGGEDRVEDDGHWYGMWIFIRYLSEKYGHDIARSLWETAVRQDGYYIFDATLADYDTNMEAALAGYSVALLTRNFEEGDNYPTVRLEGTAEPGRTYYPIDGVGDMGADYVEILAGQVVSIAINSESEELSGRLVGIQGEISTEFILGDAGVVVDASLFDHLYLIVLNLNDEINEEKCEFSDYEIVVSASEEEPVLPDIVLAAPSFIKPRVEGLLDPDDF
jgi:hypothetical protein